MKKKKRAAWVTVTVNLLFIAAICAVGWQIADHLIQDRESAELVRNLRQQAAVTAAPGSPSPAPTGQPVAVPDDNIPEETTAEPEDINEAGKQTAQPPANPPENSKAIRAEARTTPPLATEATEQIPAKAAEQSPPEDREAAPERATEAAPVQAADIPEGTASPRYPDDPDTPEAIDFDTLRLTCREAYAWLYGPGAGIDYPVMQTGNNEYYLTHLADGSKNKAGALFIDWRNGQTLQDRNTIIYGHNMKNGTMFGQLARYRDADYCRDNPFMYLYIPGHRFRLDVVAAADTTDLSEYYDQPAHRKEWNALLKQAMEKTAFDFGIPVSETDHFVTLSTCGNEYQGERWIVICRVDDPEGILPEPPE